MQHDSKNIEEQRLICNGFEKFPHWRCYEGKGYAYDDRTRNVIARVGPTDKAKIGSATECANFCAKDQTSQIHVDQRQCIGFAWVDNPQECILYGQVGRVGADVNGERCCVKGEDNPTMYVRTDRPHADRCLYQVSGET